MNDLLTTQPTDIADSGHPESPTNAGAGPNRPRRIRARRGEGERLREEILDAVELLLIKTGDAESVSIRGVGQLVGVTAPSIYRHFVDKDAMVHAACERGYERFDQHLLEAAASATDPLSAIKARALAYLRFAMAHPGEYRVLFMVRATHHDEHDALHAFDPQKSEFKALVHIADAVREAIDSGVIVPIADPMTMATMLWTSVHGIASLRIAMPDIPWPSVEDQVEVLFAMLANGMCAHPDGATRT